ncbi:MAG: MptD family putative ECF transporter S component [Sphaerochaetaceae bacterium]|nr:MptD family putative ECF transporter S component [Sphaerochaetaceae bacterium]MDC7238171.1 MptD family putative ECF transporter S component [Sphaerochaetaceae bacterium]
MSKSLNVKDLVTIGVFAILYFFIAFIVAILGVFPIFIFVIPFLTAVFGGTLVMLFMSKVNKPWALFIFGMIPPCIMWAMGHTYIVPITAILFIGIAELIFRKGKFTSLKYNTFSYSFFSCWGTGAIIQMIILKEQYIKAQIQAGISEESINQLVNLITLPTFILIIVITWIGGLIGAFVGRKMLKKHFEKAGIV